MKYSQYKHKRGGKYCSRVCAGIAKRLPPEVVKANWKKWYKEVYMAPGSETEARRKAAKSAYFQRTYDPKKAAEDRKHRAKSHVEYCKQYYSQPENKAKKFQYDSDRRARLKYGEFAEAYQLLLKIDRKVETLVDRVELRRRNGTLNKVQRRKRGYNTREAQRKALEGQTLDNSQST